jgi:hypothetical protein
LISFDHYVERDRGDRRQDKVGIGIVTTCKIILSNIVYFKSFILSNNKIYHQLTSGYSPNIAAD